MITTRKSDPKHLVIVKQHHTKSGKYQVVQNIKTMEFSWRIIARNGYITASGRGLNSVRACDKGATSCEKTLYDVFVNPRS